MSRGIIATVERRLARFSPVGAKGAYIGVCPFHAVTYDSGRAALTQVPTATAVGQWVCYGCGRSGTARLIEINAAHIRVSLESDK